MWKRRLFLREKLREVKGAARIYRLKTGFSKRRKKRSCSVGNRHKSYHTVSPYTRQIMVAFLRRCTSVSPRNLKYIARIFGVYFMGGQFDGVEIKNAVLSMPEDYL